LLFNKTFPFSNRLFSTNNQTTTGSVLHRQEGKNFQLTGSRIIVIVLTAALIFDGIIYRRLKTVVCRLRRHSLFSQSWRKKMQQSTQQQQQQQKMSNLSSPPEQQQQRNRNRRLHRNCCRRSHGSSSSNNNNTLTRMAAVTKQKPKRSSDSYIFHGGGRMALFQLRLLVLSSLVSMMMTMTFLEVVTLPSGYRSSTVYGGIIEPRNHRFEKTAQTQAQTGYYEYYFDGVRSGGRIWKVDHFATTDSSRLSKKVDRFLLFPVVTAFQQHRRYGRRTIEPTTLHRSSKSTTLRRDRAPPAAVSQFHRRGQTRVSYHGEASNNDYVADVVWKTRHTRRCGYIIG